MEGNKRRGDVAVQSVTEPLPDEARDGGGRGEARARSLKAMVMEGAAVREELPYEKFERLGPEFLTDAELLAIIIRTGTATRTPMEIGQEVLRACGARDRGLASLYHLSLRDLQEIPGIGRVKAVKLKCITELSRRISEESYKLTPERLMHPAAVARHYMERMRHEDREVVLLVSLSAAMRPIAESCLFKGTVHEAGATPREIFREALRHQAASILMLHNHPSGDPAPSESDFAATQRVAEAGRIMQIPLADHVIIGDRAYFSFKEQGYL